MIDEKRDQERMKWYATIKVGGHSFVRPSFGGPRICTYCGQEQQNVEGRACRARHD